MLTKLKYVTLQTETVQAFARFPIPQTLQTPEMFGLSIWISQNAQPIVSTYDDQTDRDADFLSLQSDLETVEAKYDRTNNN